MTTNLLRCLYDYCIKRKKKATHREFVVKFKFGDKLVLMHDPDKLLLRVLTPSVNEKE